jgi:monofunctional biosynthetic peptidoglycan transglycosylase
LIEEKRRDDPGDAVAEIGSDAGKGSPEAFPPEKGPETPPEAVAEQAAARSVDDGGSAESAVEPQVLEFAVGPEPSAAEIRDDAEPRNTIEEVDAERRADGNCARIQEPAPQPIQPEENADLQAPQVDLPTSVAGERGEAEATPAPEIAPEPIAVKSAVEAGTSATVGSWSNASFIAGSGTQGEESVRAREHWSASEPTEQHVPTSDRCGTGEVAEPDGDAPSDPLPADLIWSGPDETPPDGEQGETVGSLADGSRYAHTDGAGPSAEVAVWQAAEPPQSATLTVPTVAAVAAGAPATRDRPQPQVQPALGARRLGGYVRIAVRMAALLVVSYAALVLLLTVLYRWVDPPASALMLAQQLAGTPIEQRWVPIRRISPHLVQAVILSEDGAFCRHRGVDWSAMGEAIESTREGITRGGSTITMQVVKNLFLWSWRSYIRKAIEIPLAYLVEFFWPKARVLEIYLNIAEWGDGVFGAEAAARHHFGKSAASLTPQEAALLAVALPSPLERQPGRPGYLVRRLAGNLLSRMKTVRTTMSCVRPFAQTR